MQSGSEKIYGDLFRPHAAIQPLRLRLPAPAGAGQRVRVSPVGKSDVSFSTQGVFVGYMTR